MDIIDWILQHEHLTFAFDLILGMDSILYQVIVFENSESHLARPDTSCSLKMCTVCPKRMCSVTLHVHATQAQLRVKVVHFSFIWWCCYIARKVEGSNLEKSGCFIYMFVWGVGKP